jgi:ubiquitin-protein ligase
MDLQQQQPQQQPQQHTSSLKRTCSDTSDNSLLDCQSLQSSLKRVRLSCSPGELRLQRDLKSLVSSQGWTQNEDCFYLPEIAKLEPVSPHDPLRWVLRLHNHSTVWMQIPRMYPHRPPVILKVESSLPSSLSSSSSSTTSSNHRIQRIVVTEAPPTNSNTMSAATAAANTNTTTTSRLQDPASCGSSTTVVYNQWSPVMRLGDLLQFVIVLLTNPTLATSAAAAGAASSTSYHHHHRATALFSGCRSAPSPTHHHHHHHHAAFLEEHKMEEYQDKVAEGTVDFAPNRFEAGYGKYLDPIASTAAATGAWCANPMDVN